MADVLLLLVAAVIVIAGAGGLVLTVRASRRRAAQIRRDAPRRLMKDLRDTDGYIEQVGNALSQEDLDSLESKRKQEP